VLWVGRPGGGGVSQVSVKRVSIALSQLVGRVMPTKRVHRLMTLHFGAGAPTRAARRSAVSSLKASVCPNIRNLRSTDTRAQIRGCRLEDPPFRPALGCKGEFNGL
jgi:hypothetical protein